MEDAFKGFVSYALFRFKPMCIVRSEKVCRSGGPGTEMFFLVDGECDLVNSHTGAGRVIGENSVFEQYALMAKPEEIYRTVSTVTALTKKCILYSFSIQDFKCVFLGRDCCCVRHHRLLTDVALSLSVVLARSAPSESSKTSRQP